MRRPGVCVWGAFWFFITDATTRSQHFNVSKKKEEAKSFFFFAAFVSSTHPPRPPSLELLLYAQIGSLPYCTVCRAVQRNEELKIGLSPQRREDGVENKKKKSE